MAAGEHCRSVQPTGLAPLWVYGYMSGFVVAGSVRLWHCRRSVLLLLSEVCVVGDAVGLHKSGLVVIESALTCLALP